MPISHHNKILVVANAQAPHTTKYNVEMEQHFVAQTRKNFENSENCLKYTLRGDFRFPKSKLIY